MKDEVTINKKDWNLITTLLKALIVFNDDSVEVSMPKSVTDIVSFDDMSESDFKEGMSFICIMEILTKLGIPLDDLLKELDGKIRSINKESGITYDDSQGTYIDILKGINNKEDTDSIVGFIPQLVYKSYNKFSILPTENNKEEKHE